MPRPSLPEDELASPDAQGYDQQHLIADKTHERVLHVDQRSFIVQVALCLLLAVLSIVAVTSTFYAQSLHSLQAVYPPPNSTLPLCQAPPALPPVAAAVDVAPPTESVPPAAPSADAAAEFQFDYDPATSNFVVAAAGARYPLPGVKVHNFTVDPSLPPSRWPASIDSRSHRNESAPPVPDATEAFLAGSPHRFQGSVRGAVVTLYTPNQHDNLMQRFKENDELFLGAMADHSDMILFYTIYPVSAEDAVHADLGTLGCREITNSRSQSSTEPTNSNIYARLRHPGIAYPEDLSSVREFISPKGTHIITVPIAVNLPLHVLNNPGKLKRYDWMACANMRWSLNYVLFSGAVFSSKLLFHPIMRGYDYFIKMDLDIHFLKPIPGPSLFQSMADQHCIWMHSKVIQDDREDCSKDGPEAVEAWAAEHQTKPASLGTKWWKSYHYYYGNFQGGWLGWFRSVENKQLATWLYENERHPGYFQHRWGDQPPFIKMVGMWFSLTEESVLGEPRTTAEKPVSSAICNFEQLRNTQFVHQ